MKLFLKIFEYTGHFDKEMKKLPIFISDIRGFVLPQQAVLATGSFCIYCEQIIRSALTLSIHRECFMAYASAPHFWKCKCEFTFKRPPSLDLGEYIKQVEAYDPCRGGVLFALGDSSTQHLESSDFGQTWLQTDVNRFQQENASSPSFAPSDILAVSVGQLPESMVKCVHLHSGWEG